MESNIYDKFQIAAIQSFKNNIPKKSSIKKVFEQFANGYGPTNDNDPYSDAVAYETFAEYQKNGGTEKLSNLTTIPISNFIDSQDMGEQFFNGKTSLTDKIVVSKVHGLRRNPQENT